MTNTRNRQNPLFPLALLAVSIIAYFLPWVINPGVSLTLNAYNLADWISLTPAARAVTPILLDSLLLRLPLLCVVWTMMFYTARLTWLSVLLLAIFAIALLPPFEFFTQATDDSNYRQQFVLSAMIFLGGLIIITGRLKHWRNEAVCVITLVGAVSAIAGFVRAQEIMRQFRLPADTGTGIIMLALLSIALVSYALFMRQKTRQFSPNP